MADQVSSWALTLEDEISGAAKNAAQALSQLETQIAADTKELAAMQKAMRNLQGSTVVNVDQARKLKSAIDAKKDSIAKAQTHVMALGKSFTSVSGGTSSFKKRFEELSKQMQSVPGPLGNMIGAFGKFKSLVGGGMIAGGIIAIAAALTTLVVASVAAARSLYQYGVAQADARRSELLRLEGLTKLRNMYSRIPGNAKEMQGAIDRVAASSPTARAEIVKYAESLHRMGLRGATAEKVLGAVSMKHAVHGAAAASGFAAMAAGSALAGRGVDKMVDKVQSRIGGTAQKMMSSLTVQTEKQKEAFNSLFGALDMEAYLDAWKGVNDLLGQATASGRALKFMLTGLLQPLIDGSTAGAAVTKRFFQGMIIAALHLTIAILTVRQWWRRTFGTSEQKKSLDDGAKWVYLGEAALGALVVGLGLASVAVVGLSLKLTGWLIPSLVRATAAIFRFGLSGIAGALRGLLSLTLGFFRLGLSALMALPSLWAAVAPLLPFIAAAIGVAAAIFMLIKLWDQLSNSFKQIEWAQMGRDILQGIINGLTNPSALFASLKQLALDGVHVFKEALGISSPSKVFMRAGLAIPEGAALGVTSGTPDATQATQDMASAMSPDLGSASGARGALDGQPAGAAGGGGKGNSISIGAVNVYSQGTDGKQLAADFRAELSRTLEGLLLEIGAPTPA